MCELKIVNRSDGIRWICQHRINELSIDERDSIILSWWGIYENDPEFHILSEDIKNEMKNLDSCEDPSNLKYNPLILEALVYSYRGVLNSYILKKLNEIGIRNINVSGKEEVLQSCPCCGYRTLNLIGEYDICKVCFWEDDGNNNSLNYSHVNKMTLEEAQNNFIKYQACSENSIVFLDPDRIIKFSRDNKHKTDPRP